MSRGCRNLVIVLGDQFNADAAAFDGFEANVDSVWMAEVAHESEKVWSHKARIALFLSAMRHLRDHLLRLGTKVSYRQLDDPDNRGSFAAELERSINELRPQRLIVAQPGEWTGETDMNCLREVIVQTLERAYAHHIQRLMVTGNFDMLLGVSPCSLHEWYLAVYADAVEWVELPNTLGMSQFADGGIMASKPYAATGKYINRMSNYCDNCRCDPARRTGTEACPFTTLYWDFLLRNAVRLDGSARMSLQLRNAARLTAAERRKLTGRADVLRQEMV